MASSSLLNLANPFTSHRVDLTSSTSGFRTNSLRFSAIARKYEPTKCTQVSGLSISVKGRSCSFVARADDAEAGEAVVEEESGGESVEEESGGESVETEEEKPPRQTRVKLGDVMGILNKRAIEASDSVRPTPDLRVGDVVEIKLEVPENRRRLSMYKGIVMGKQNAGIHTTIRIRRIIAGVGVEIVFPVYSPMIKEIRVLSHRKVRRAKLYYLRDKLPRLSTFK